MRLRALALATLLAFASNAMSADVAPVATVVAADPTAAEGTPPDIGLYTISLGAPATIAITVNFIISGTATAGTDYNDLGVSVVIPVGETSVDLKVTPTNDTLAEPNETVVLTLAEGQGYVVGAAKIATINIANVPSGGTATITATDPVATENAAADTATFTITLTNTPTEDIVVKYSVSGTATAGTDYTALGTSVTIPAGSNSATLVIKPIQDTLVEAPETVTVTLAASNAYAIGTDSNATAVILDSNSTSAVAVIAAVDSNAQEGATPNKASLIVALSKAPATTVTVNYTVSGSALSTDYTPLPNSVVIGTTGFAIIDVVPLNDDIAELKKTLTVTLATGTGYSIGSLNSASVQIGDDDTLGTVSVDATDTVAGEGSNKGEFTITATQAPTQPTTIGYKVTGTATPGADYAPLSGSVTFMPGITSITLPVTALLDFLDESTETIVLTLDTGTTYLLGNATATVNILNASAKSNTQGTVSFSDAYKESPILLENPSNIAFLGTVPEGNLSISASIDLPAQTFGKLTPQSKIAIVLGSYSFTKTLEQASTSTTTDKGGTAIYTESYGQIVLKWTSKKLSAKVTSKGTTNFLTIFAKQYDGQNTGIDFSGNFDILFGDALAIIPFTVKGKAVTKTVTKPLVQPITVSTISVKGSGKI